ncbi:MAG: hypothetical protein ACJ8FY_15235 [Gemmataceae bacterium]
MKDVAPCLDILGRCEFAFLDEISGPLHDEFKKASSSIDRRHDLIASHHDSVVASSFEMQLHRSLQLDDWFTLHFICGRIVKSERHKALFDLGFVVAKQLLALEAGNKPDSGQLLAAINRLSGGDLRLAQELLPASGFYECLEANYIYLEVSLDDADQIPHKDTGNKRRQGQSLRSWTQHELDAAIRTYRAKRATSYKDLKEGVEKHLKGAIKSAQSMFGRNAIARALKVRAPAMVSKSEAWKEIAQELRLSRKSRPSRPRTRVGLDGALEEASVGQMRDAIDQPARNEIISRLLDNLPDSHAKAIIDKLSLGQITEEDACEVIELYLDQQRDDQSSNCYQSP